MVRSTTEDRMVSGSHMGAIACSKPFVVQELVIISKDLLRLRAKQHAKARLPSGDPAQPKERDLA